MCLAIMQPKSYRVPNTVLSKGWESNRDGAGLAYCVNGEVRIVKGIFDLLDLIRTYEQIDTDQTPVLLHLRNAMYGIRCSGNTHPFWITPRRLALVHNGTIQMDRPRDSRRSDSWHMARTLRSWIDPEAVPTVEMMDLISKAVGPTNSIAWLDWSGNTTILGEDRGYWSDGIWYSNESYYETRTNVPRMGADPSVCWSCGSALSAHGEVISGYCRPCLKEFATI